MKIPRHDQDAIVHGVLFSCNCAVISRPMSKTGVQRNHDASIH